MRDLCHKCPVDYLWQHEVHLTMCPQMSGRLSVALSVCACVTFHGYPRMRGHPGGPCGSLWEITLMYIHKYYLLRPGISYLIIFLVVFYYNLFFCFQFINNNILIIIVHNNNKFKSKLSNLIRSFASSTSRWYCSVTQQLCIVVCVPSRGLSEAGLRCNY